MQEVVLGIDLGTSAVKIIAVDKEGQVLVTVSEPLTLIQQQPGYNEQDPDEWLDAVKQGIKRVTQHDSLKHHTIQGISFSGQMHGLVPLDKNGCPVRHAILWNDTRNSAQCEQIIARYGQRLNGNPILEGFTLPKMLWMQQHEPELWKQVDTFVLPKDYIRYGLTGQIHMEYSDAASTLLLNPTTHEWTREIGDAFGLGEIYPPLIPSHGYVGNVKSGLAIELGLTSNVKVFAGGGDNACGAIGAGVVNDNDTLCSIGTSGVIVNVEKDEHTQYQNNIHFFNHSVPNTYYAMGVTLAAGYSLSWLKHTFFASDSYDDVIKLAASSSIGANRLLYTPYLAGERTPHGDAFIRGSFIGLSGSHTKADFSRAVIEGVTYSLYDSIQLMRAAGKEITHVTSIGGGAKSEFWLQLQADVFNTTVRKLKHEEGPSMGAAMIAAVGLNWFESIEDCVDAFIDIVAEFHPNPERHRQYEQFYQIYQQVYAQTRTITQQLLTLEI
ncbi:xylulokinase [Staphylococcus lugdunensis]|uniref:xylulokinase n=1 Tax=Staphylococcus TaxID=1279 RepID=UPI0008A4A607|nr:MULTISPECIES: xylulokinase [Staphylococcus]ARJ13117.1 xylulokinase [Staphylococcus lugdunensis]MCH8665294.1 xylulokinase [Staphylococcus lugdunensis]OFJ63608.1 xylulokinase [Staphylococcus sp. HMSC077E11]OFM45614.1 xylulokinase [Staphylococcus sp. HMSC077E12]OFR88412.1 xylulokinase [Staphylococcus sp. HMSC059F04]